MRTKTILFVTAAVALVCSSVLAQPPVKAPKAGPSILHFFVRKGMVTTGLNTNALGRVEANRNQQGNADNQRLDIIVSRLETNATYQLLALLDDDTNYTQVAQFATGTNAAAALHYVRVGSSQNPNAGLGRGKTALPAALNPISDIRALAVADSSTQAVLFADLTTPDKLQYLIKRSLHNDGVDTNAAGSLSIMATTSKASFKLLASGLDPSANYFLAANGVIVDTHTTSTNGMLSFTDLAVSPGDILKVRTVAVWDSASNSVLSTKLP